MKTAGWYRLTSMFVLTLAIWMIGGLVASVVGETPDDKQLASSHSERLSADPVSPSAVPTEVIAKIPRRAAEFDRVRATARAEGSVRVIVQLDVPNVKALTAAAIAAKGQGPVAATDGQLSGAIRNFRGGELAKLAGIPHSINRTYDSVPFVAMTVSEQALDTLEASPGVMGVNEDHLAAPTLDNTVNITGASTAWTQGFDGSGWYVAILDTGIRASHNFFAGKNIVQACFSSGEDGVPGAGDCPNGLSTDTTSPNAARHFPTSPTSDHGTHVSGIAAGNDPLRVPPLYGIARGADIIAVQVFSQFFGLGGVRSYSSDQIAGLEYVFSLRSTYNIASANMSLGGGQYFDQASCDAANLAVKAAIDNLRGAGIATVIASGNDGFCTSMGGPGCISSAVAVGNTQDNDLEAIDSSFHSTMLELYAPGSSVLSSVGASNSSYASYSGTSMAAPHVAGAWAVLKQADPAGSVDDLLAALQSTGDPVTGRCVPSPTQKRIQIDLAVGTKRIKFSQPPDSTGEDAASNIDLSDMTPNTVVADDFVSDGRPIYGVVWWGSNISDGSVAAGASAASPSPALPVSTASVRPTHYVLDDGASKRVHAKSKAPRVSGSGDSADRPFGHAVQPATQRQQSNVALVGGDTCGTATAIGGLPYSDTGDTCSFSDDYDEACPFDTPGSPDVVYSFTPATDTVVTISLCANSAYDTKVYVYENSCGGYQSGVFKGCNDDACSSPTVVDWVSRISGLLLTGGNTYYIVVDGYDEACGAYTLDIDGLEVGPCPNPGACLLANEDFEHGTLCGWTTTDTGTGGWVVNDGTLDPDSPDGPLPPCGGAYSAMTNPTGPGVRTLYQDVTISAAASVRLTWVDMLRNHGSDYVDPGQEFRVEVRDPADNSLLAPIFSTNPGDAAFQECTPRCADLSAFAGQTIRLAFEVEDSLFYFNVHVDDVCITTDAACPTGACCRAGTQVCDLDQVAANCVALGGIYQGDDTEVCTTCPPIICGDGIVGPGEQCDPPDGLLCDGACQSIPNPPIDGWMISFHEPLEEGGSASPPLALYFCDAAIVGISPAPLAACDSHPVRRYEASLIDCCLVHSFPDSRNSLTPGEPEAFLETECFAYDIDIQAVVGRKYVDIAGVCTEVLTGNSAAIDYWGWHTTSIEHGQRPALKSVVSMSGSDWLYGPWSALTPTCSAPNMAFQLLTDLSGGGDCNANGIPDSCESLPDCQPNGTPDECEIASGASEDCDLNTVPDECELLSDPDCNENGILDVCDGVAVGSIVSSIAPVLGFTDISGTGTAMNLGDDEAANVVMPFSPAFIGGSTVSVANNGGIGFVPGSGLGAVDNWPLPHLNAFGGNPGLLPFWDDLDSTTGSLYHETVGVTGNRTFIVQWHNRPHYPGDGTLNGNEVTFQVQIFESPVGGVVAQYLYADTDFLNPAFNHGASATVGFQRNVTSAIQWSYNSAGAVNPGVVLSLLKSDLNGNGQPDECEPPGEIDWDSSDTSAERATRALRFSVTGSPSLNAIKVTMIDLQNPVPANLPQYPPPNFSAYESGTCAAGGETNGCARWVGKPGTFYETQGPPLAGPYRAARLQCTPVYWDWATETAIDPIVVVGAEILPSSQYSVQTYATSCIGAETGCTNVSTPVAIYTRRSGEVDEDYNPPSATNQPNAIDVAQVVNKFKNLVGSPDHYRAQIQPNLPELNASTNALDIVAVVDAVKGFAYAFSGPCPCPSLVTCGGTCTGCAGMCVKTCNGGDNAGEPCINDNHCPGGGVCGTPGICNGGSRNGLACGTPANCPGGGCNVGFCRDACGRCKP